jgi:hypothetical protein
MKQLTKFIKNSLSQIRNIKFEIRNKSSLGGTMLPIHWNLFINNMRLPRFSRNDVTFTNQKSKIKNQKLLFILHTLYFILFSTYSKAQTILDSSKLISEFTVNAKFIQADDIGNIYIVSPTNQLYKYNYTGKVLATLNYNYNGNISSIDASNSMEIYVFYKEINKVLLLDNNLAYRGEIDLTKLNITQAAAIARSYDNGIWVFDLGDLQLKKITKDGVLSQSSGNIKQFTQTDFIPNIISDNTNQIMLCNDSVCLVFDVFAAYYITLNFKNSQSFQLGNNQIFNTNGLNISTTDLKINYRKNIYTFTNNIIPKWTLINKEKIITFCNSNVCIYSK